MRKSSFGGLLANSSHHLMLPANTYKLFQYATLSFIDKHSMHRNDWHNLVFEDFMSWINFNEKWFLKEKVNRNVIVSKDLKKKPL